MKRILYFFLSISLFACESPENLSSQDEFFSMDSLKSVLSKNLEGRFLKKILTKDEESQNQEITDPDWEKELEILSEFDLDKSAYSGEYEITNQERNQTFILKEENQNLKVKSQSISNNPNGEVLIKSIRIDDNPLFSSSVEMSLLMSNGTLEALNLDFKKEIIFLGSESYQLQLIPMN